MSINNPNNHIGTTIPAHNPYAVSVSLPTIDAIIGYEEGDPAVIDLMEGGYPRFFENKLIQQLSLWVQQQYPTELTNQYHWFAINSVHAAHTIEKQLNITYIIKEYEGAVWLLIAKDDTHAILAVKNFIRNAGLLTSARLAARILHKVGALDVLFNEALAPAVSAYNTIVHTLQDGYGPDSKIYICNSGMNAIYACLSQVYQLTKGDSGNKKILQLGWLYIDSLELLQNYHFPTADILDVQDMKAIATYLEQHHHEIAFVFAELISNPTLQCIDIIALQQLLQQYNIPLVVDSSIASAYTTEALQYCDIIVESLTKFANGHADVLQGAIIVNQKSKTLPLELLQFEDIEIAYEGDIQRMAICIQNYAQRMQVISANTQEIYTYLKDSPQLNKIYCTDDNPNFKKIARKNATVGMISIVTKNDLANTYDVLQLAKGPSLGTEFTLCMPYVYLAHYADIQDPDKYTLIAAQGLDKNLLRISIGTEPIEYLKEKFEIFL